MSNSFSKGTIKARMALLTGGQGCTPSIPSIYFGRGAMRACAFSPGRTLYKAVLIFLVFIFLLLI